MGPRCPECNYDLSQRSSSRCPECGSEWTDDQLRDWKRLSKNPQTRAKLLGYGCLLVLCLFIAAITVATAVGYNAPHLVFASMLFLGIALVLGVVMQRTR